MTQQTQKAVTDLASLVREGISSKCGRQVGEGIWMVSFMHYDLGFFDNEKGRVLVEAL